MSVIRMGIIRAGRAALVIGVVFTAACGGDAEEAPAAAAAPVSVQIGPENVVRVEQGDIVIGPLISGELRAEHEATVRAELGGAMLQVEVQEGQTVRKGALLGRINARTLDDARQSAELALRSAQAQLDVATREAQRTEELVGAGALAARDVDLARSNVTAAEAQLADARARLASAQTQLADAVIRAPIAGVIARRAVNVGDVVSPGTELFIVIDPSSMRLEASVPSDDLQALQPGARVQFRVRGYADPFEGRIERISPRADVTTRQVPIFVAIPNVGGRLVAGLFAEGRIVQQSAAGLVVPLNAVNTAGEQPWVLKVIDGRAERVPVTVGLRDNRSERLQITEGVGAGDILLRGAAQGITPGTPVQVGGAT